MADSLTSIKPPAPLIVSENQVENWKLFKQAWNNYAIIIDIDSKKEDYKKALFLHCIGTAALKVYNTLSFNDKENKLSHIIDKLENHLIGEINETYERYKFNQRQQAEFESFDDYLTTLKHLAKTCNFGELQDSLLRDRLVVGITSVNTRKRLLQERDLTLKKCIDICRGSEASERQLKAITKTEDASANKLEQQGRIHRSQHHKYTPPSRLPSAMSTDSSRAPPRGNKCKFCAHVHIFKKELCPAWGKTCSKCKSKNHFAVCCTRSQPPRAYVLQDDQYKNEQDEYLLTLSHNQKKAIFIKLIMDDDPVKFQIDSGATANVLPLSLVKHRDRSTIEKTTTVLRTFNNQTVKCVGTIFKILTNPLTKSQHKLELLVVDAPNTIPIIGKLSSEALGVIEVNYDNFEHINCVQATEHIIDKFSDVFEKPIGCLPNKTHLTLRPDVVPTNSKAARLPITLRDRVKAELSRLQNLSVIAPVNTPTEWCSRMVIATKSTGDLRICIDPKALNESLMKEKFQLPVMDEILPSLTKARIFTKLDVKSAFWHCELDDESSLLTAFATPYGTFRWKRLPFGLCVSSEIFQRQLTQALMGLPGTFFAMDDIIVIGSGTTDEEAIKDHNKNLTALLLKCRQKNIALNKSKMMLCKKEISFLGHRITSKGLEADPEKVKAVLNMQTPQDVKAVQRMIGFINYLAKFLPQLSHVMMPIRSLLSNETNFHWGEAQEKAFLEIKKLVTEAPVLAYYNPDKECAIQCDASDRGLGASLLQEGKPIAYASRALSDTETRYATIEKETLAIIFALQKFHQYTFGRKTKIHSDHKPLEAIFRKPLSSMPRRLQGMMLRIQQYDVEICYKKGSEMHLADTLSRAYLPTCEGQLEFEQVNYAQEIAVRPERLRRIQQETVNDPNLSLLKEFITNGWPHHSSIPTPLAPYANFKDELSISDNIIFNGSKVVIPAACRGEMKTALHSSHRAVDACLRRAHEILYWPTMNSDIKHHVKNCESCQSYPSSNPKEPLIPHAVPSHAWEKVGIDIFYFSSAKYLVIVDYLTDFFEIDKLENETAQCVIKKMKQQFARYGIPSMVISDGGPCFASHPFKEFAQVYDFGHQMSSPYHQQANGKAENAVKQAKNLLRKATESRSDPYIGLLELRNTPDPHTGLSPAQKFHCRVLRSTIPTTKSTLNHRSCNYPKIKKQQEQNKIRQKQYFDNHTRHLPILCPGDPILIAPSLKGERKWRPGTIVRPTKDNTRSYVVKTSQGNTIIRNRLHLRPRLNTKPVALFDFPVDYPLAENQPPPTPAPPKQGPSNIPVRTTRSGRISRPPRRYSPS